MKNITYSNHGITYPKGFLTAGVNAGIKENRNDMAMIYSEVPAECAIVCTTNKVKAAPVLWDTKITEDGSKKQAVVINVGSANACTGEEGYNNAVKTAEMAGELLKLAPEDILVSSTGVIGVQLEMDKIKAGVNKLSTILDSSEKNSEEAAKAILTTDTVTKTASAEFEIDGKTVRLGAMCKGSGMIRPNMATMLSFCTTDVNITQECLQKALDTVVVDTYNMISVDGDMSTNDTALVLANGMAENEIITDLNSEAGQIFLEALYHIEEDLAKQIVKDGEGATKALEVQVSGAKTKEDARVLARSVAESNLVKAAMFGRDANWGRIISSLGSADADFDPSKVSLVIKSKSGSIDLFNNNHPVEFSEDKALEILSEPEIDIIINCNLGDQSATAWGCDLTYDYVKINGEYRS